LSALTSCFDRGNDDIYERIATAIADQGYVVLPSALPEHLVTALFVHFQSIDRNKFSNAGVGRENDHQINPFVRSDEICWIDGSHATTRTYLDWIENLRLALNRRLYLGLFDYECGYAYYPEGAFYKKHRDAFHGNTNRVLSLVLYLNPDWMPGDGGELLLFDRDGETVIENITPTFGKLVIFLSEEFPHEVCGTNKPRRSIAGWFRVNNSDGNTVDPPR
jgi:SM-20-related protein